MKRLLQHKKNPTPFKLTGGITERALDTFEDDPLFDKEHYEAVSGRRFDTKRAAVEHYSAEGWRKRLSPNAQFDPDLYLSVHADDINQRNLDPFWHFVSHGHKEPYRIPSYTVGSFTEYHSQMHDAQVADNSYSRLGCLRYLSGKRRKWIGIYLDQVVIFERLKKLIRRIKENFNVDVVVFNLTSSTGQYEQLKRETEISLCADVDRDHIKREQMREHLAGWLRDPFLVANLIVSDDNPGFDGLRLDFSPGVSSDHVIHFIEEKMRVDRRYPVYFLQTDWSISGVNTFTETLVSELKHSSRYRPVILLTHNISEEEFRFLPDVEIKRFPYAGDRRSHLRSLKTFLEEQDCILISNYDIWGESIIPGLSSRVRTIGIIHSDDDAYYERVTRLGRYYDYCVNISSAIQSEVISIHPELESRCEVIRYGIEPFFSKDRREELIAEKAKRLKEDGVIRLCYVGRLVQYQKRAMDLVHLTKALEKNRIKYKFDIVGDGETREEMMQLLAEQIEAGSVIFHGRMDGKDLAQVYAAAHALVLVSEFEGLPLSVLEAISSGCVPAMYEIRSGISEILADQESCVLAPQSDYSELAKRIGKLKNRRVYSKLANGAAQAFETNGLTEIEMTKSYLDVFERLMSKDWSFERPRVYAYPDYQDLGALPPPMEK